MTGRVCIITGGAQGIGRTMSKHFATRGETVVIADLNAAEGGHVAAEIETSGGRALFVETDVADPSSVADMVSRVRETFGPAEVLINNARRIATGECPVEEISDEEWNETLRVNVTGAFNAIRAIVPDMKKAGWGRIINMSSATVLLPPTQRNYCHYIATKAALIGITRALAHELGPFGITINAILPGAVVTEVVRSGIEAREARAKQVQSIPRLETPEDLVGAAYFFVSDESAFITGQSLAVDGGMSFS